MSGERWGESKQERSRSEEADEAETAEERGRRDRMVGGSGGRVRVEGGRERDHVVGREAEGVVRALVREAVRLAAGG
eukprot:3273405-Rhodomonas_salina.2